MFKKDIDRTIGKVLSLDKHIMIPISKHCIYYIKRYSDKLAFYVRCSDSRHLDGGVSVELYYTAIQVPDDGIMSFDVGVHVHILTIYTNITDECFVEAGKKVISIEKGIGGLSDMIINEIGEPYFPKQSTMVYNQSVLVYDILKNDNDIHEQFVQLEEQVCDLIKRKKSSEIYDICCAFFNGLSSEYFTSKGIAISQEVIKNRFSRHIYAQCVLNI